nr:endogenous retrovirus group K member 6 Gag polyprotein-like [Microcebus murinus]
MGNIPLRRFMWPIRDLLSSQGVHCEEKTLIKFLKEVDRVAPWFLHSGSLTIPSWGKLGRDLRSAGTLRPGTLLVHNLIMECLHDESSGLRVAASQKALDDLQDASSERSSRGGTAGIRKCRALEKEMQGGKAQPDLPNCDPLPDFDNLHLSDTADSESECGEGPESDEELEKKEVQGFQEVDRNGRYRPPPYAPPYEELGARPRQRGARQGDSFIHPEERKELFLTFPVFENDNQRGWEPVNAKQLKELAEAVRNWGHGASYTLSLVERLGNTAMTPRDWSQLVKAVLTTGQYLDWKSINQEECMEQSRRNAQRGQPAWNFDMLTGQGQWVNNQVAYPEEVYAQINSIAIKAWKSLPNRGEVKGNLTKIIQAPAEPFSDFVARLVEAAGKVFGDLDTAMPLIEQLAFEQCTTECRNAIAPWKNKGLNAWLKACREIGGPLTNSGLAAAVLAAQAKQERNCYNCGKPGHLKRQCRAPPKQGSSSNKQPGICPTCGKGRHWASECRSMKDKDGNPIVRDQNGKPVPKQKNGWRGPRPQGPQIYGAMQGNTQERSLLAPPGSQGEPLKVPQDWTSVPPPQQY